MYPDRTVYLLHIPIFRLRATPSVDRPPRTITDRISVRHLENIVDTRPDRAPQHTVRLIHIIPCRRQSQRPVAAYTRIRYQFTPVIYIQVAVLAIHHRTFAFGSNLISVRSRIMDICYRGRASLIVETAVCLVMERMRTCRIGFFHIDFHLGKFLVPIGFIRYRPEDHRRMIPVKMDCLHICL